MRAIALACSALVLTACASTAEPGPGGDGGGQATNQNDCAVIAAVAKGHYEFDRANNVPPPLWLFSETGDWSPRCDWSRFGLNFPTTYDPDRRHRPGERVQWVQFRKPVYDGKIARVTGTPDGDALTLLVESDGARCATGRASLPGSSPAPAIDSLPAGTPPAERPQASEASLAPGLALGIAPAVIDDATLAAYLADVRETETLYRTEKLVHPGQMLWLANKALVENVNWSMRPDPNENTGAGNARDLLGHLIASQLGLNVVIHQGPGSQPVVLAPLRGLSRGAVEVELVMVNGQVTYRPHQRWSAG